MTSHDSTAVVWFRSDLRLDDNPAWAAATSRHDRVVALFVLDNRLLEAGGVHRRALFSGHLGALDSTLRDHGGRLVIRSADEGIPIAEAAGLAVVEAVTEVGACELHLNADVGPLAQQRDHLVGRLLAEEHGVKVHSWWGRTVHRPGTVLTKKGTLSRVFTPFHKEWEATALDDWPEPGEAAVLAPEGVEPPEPEVSPCMEPGEQAAGERLAAWLDIVDDYAETARNLPAMTGTSQLSADLRFGTIAARQIAADVGTATEGRSAYVRQLAWRDWYTHMMWEMPSMVDSAVRSEYDAIEWQDDPDEFAAWCAGRTGYPIVDAGMRQLVETGWMHNRLRMICASFLVKDLLVDWRRGERFFRHHLIDADLSQNVGNWQWVAGTGPDAAPYFRVFNPSAQQEKWDPDGEFVSRWVDPADADYPEPIVDHAASRDRALAAYRSATGAD